MKDMITDETILKAAKKYVCEDYGRTYPHYAGFQDGAKWMQDQSMRWVKASEDRPIEWGRYWCYYDKHGDCWLDDVMFITVTHWMPLPPNPTIK